MSEIISVPEWAISKSGEEVSQRFLDWISTTQKKLLRAFPRGEKAFCRIIDKMCSRLHPRWKRRLWYTRQKYFVVAPSVVFFGDFYFGDMRLLVEIDGNSHLGGIAAEKDLWRSQLITAWKTKTIRVTNAQVMDGDFRGIEKWFITEAVNWGPCQVGNQLLKDYDAMRMIYPSIYNDTSTLTTYKSK